MTTVGKKKRDVCFGFIVAAVFSLLLFNTGPVAWAGEKENAAMLSTTADYEGILRVIDQYIEGGRQGKGEVMKKAFHDGAGIFAHVNNEPFGGPMQVLYDRVDSRPPAGEIAYAVASVEIAGTIAMARVEIENWAGNKYTDMFTLLRVGDGWLITCKVSHQR